jgi:hypothetical protein
MSTVAERLAKVLIAGNLTVSDLARWFERPRPTVQDWVNGTEPWGAPLDRARVEQQLQKLEQMIHSRTGFPVPMSISRAERIDYIARVRSAAQ